MDIFHTRKNCDLPAFVLMMRTSHEEYLQTLPFLHGESDDRGNRTRVSSVYILNSPRISNARTGLDTVTSEKAK